MVKEADDSFQYSDTPLGNAQRNAREAGRFATQTNDPQFGPSAELLQQHKVIAEKKLAMARKECQKVGFTEEQFQTLCHQGMVDHLIQRGTLRRVTELDFKGVVLLPSRN